jgi:hypothetical protein
VIVGALSTYSIVNPREENRTVDRSDSLDQDAVDVSGWTSFRPQRPMLIMLVPGLRCTRRSGARRRREVKLDVSVEFHRFE